MSLPESKAEPLSVLINNFLTEIEALASVIEEDEMNLLKHSISALIEVYRYGL